LPLWGLIHPRLTAGGAGPLWLLLNHDFHFPPVDVSPLGNLSLHFYL
jgi:hypothetical protein